MGTNKKKILIMRLGAIGDVVHSTVIAQSIKQKYPNSEVHFLTQSVIKPLVELSPNVDKVFEFDRAKKDNLFYLMQLCFKFMKEKYDVIFSLTNSFRDYFVAFFSFPKKRVKRKKVNKHAVIRFFDTACDYDKDLDLPKNLELIIPNELEAEIKEKLKQYERPYFVFNTGGAHDNERQGRIWAEKNWIELGGKLVEKYGGTIFFCGSKAERASHEVYKEINNSVIFSGELSLVQSAALYKQSDLMISGDSGPLHIADALGVNAIALMGSTSPVLCGPYGTNSKYIGPNIDCKYCGQKKCTKLMQDKKITPCMESITVENVVEMIEKM